ncbi:MAG: TlpA disulfide reductase family protein [Ramlibacter sp.]
MRKARVDMPGATPIGRAGTAPTGQSLAAPRRRAWLLLVGVAGLVTVVQWGVRMSARSAEAPGLILHARPRELPPLRFADGSGAPTSLAAFRGKVVLLNVWATWCPPCVAEMPTLDRLQAALGGADFEVVALSIDSAGAPAVQAFFLRTGIKKLHPYVDAFQEALTSLAGAGIPLTLLIDRDGREIGRKQGPAEWDQPQMLQLIRDQLQRTAASRAPASGSGR